MKLVFVGIVFKARPRCIPPDMYSATLCERLQKCRLTRAVFSDEEGHGCCEMDGLRLMKNWLVERITIPQGILVRMECDAFKMHDFNRSKGRLAPAVTRSNICRGAVHFSFWKYSPLSSFRYSVFGCAIPSLAQRSDPPATLLFLPNALK